MKIEKPCTILIATALLAACASQPPATAQQTAAPTAKPAAAASAASAAGNKDTGPFHRVVRDGQTLYCDDGPQLGSRMARPRCLTEAQFQQWQEQNAYYKEEVERGKANAITSGTRDPGPAPR
jgi:hypothetical protein